MKVENNNTPSQADGTQQNVAEQAPVQVVQVDPRILNLLMEDKIEQANERKAKRDAAERKRESYRRGSEANEQLLREAIQKCCKKGHLKGGKYRKKTAVRDVAFALHTFIQGEQRINCMLCGLKVWGPRQGGKVPADSKELVWIDNGNGFRSQPNPSYAPELGLPGIGFAEALKLLQDESTNVESKSETVITNPQITLNQQEKEIADLKARLAEAEKKNQQ